MGARSTMDGAALRGRRILVVEDEPFIALDIAAAIEDASGAVIGPAATVAEALALAAAGGAAIDGAILDFNLPDGPITPVVALLSDRSIPTVLHTALTLPAAFAQRYPSVALQPKPTSADMLVSALATLLPAARVVESA